MCPATMTTGRLGRTPPEEWMSFFDSRPCCPAVSSDRFRLPRRTDPLRLAVHQLAFGIYDTCGFPKDQLLVLPVVVGRPAGVAPAAPLELAGKEARRRMCGH